MEEQSGWFLIKYHDPQTPLKTLLTTQLHGRDDATPIQLLAQNMGEERAPSNLIRMLNWP